MPNKIFSWLQYILPHHALSRLAGRIAASKTGWLKNGLIRGFIRLYQIDLSTAQRTQMHAYESFNDFFTRELKTELRPINHAADSICAPVDGCISQFGVIHQQSIIQAKGMHYSLPALLASKPEEDTALHQLFINGYFITLYLSPADYHRVHMPIAGTLYRADYIPGRLFAVNETSVHTINNLFGRNERLICYFDTVTGPMILIMVGALFVAGIETIWTQQQQQMLATQPLPLAKGEEIGRFTFGSTVILLCNNQIHLAWQHNLTPGAPVQFGQTIAQWRSINARSEHS